MDSNKITRFRGKRHDASKLKASIELFSSWAMVMLKETGDAEFCLGFFESVEGTVDWRAS